MKALTRIERVVEQRDDHTKRMNARLAELVERAHDEGASWSQVAEAMGITRQGLGLFRDRHRVIARRAKRVETPMAPPHRQNGEAERD